MEPGISVFRPPLDPARRLRLVLALSVPLPSECACGQIGISPHTYQIWLSRGRKLRDGALEQPTAMDRWCLRLLIDVERALGDAEEVLAQSILAHARHDWKAAAHYLACRFPDRWAKNERRQIEARVRRDDPETADPQEELQRLLADPDIAAAIEASAYSTLENEGEDEPVQIPHKPVNGKAHGTPHA